MNKVSDATALPSLLERQSSGGDIGEGGINFQADVILSYIPKWLSIEGFTSMLREGMVDAEAMFFVPGHGYKKEAVEVKDNVVIPSKFWAEVDRFKDIDVASPGDYQWFTFAAAGLSKELHPILNGLRRIRDPYSFYEGSPLMENSYDEYSRRVRDAGRSDEDAEFLFKRVLIDGNLSTVRDHGFAIFQHSLHLHLPHYLDVPSPIVKDIYSDLSTLVRSKRNTPISRIELEKVLRHRVPNHFLPSVSRLKVHTAIEDLEPATDQRAVRFQWTRFFEPGSEGYPPPDKWNTDVVGELQETKEWILKHRDTRRIVLSGTRRLSASLAIGSVFSAVAGFYIEMIYRDGVVWATDAHADAETPSYPLTPDDLPQLRKADRLVVSVSIIQNISDEVDSSLKESGLTDASKLHIRGEQPITSPQQANLAVRGIKTLICDALSKTGARQLDLFFAGPAFLALFLGHRLNATMWVQCHERIAPGRYVPTCLLFA